MSLAKELIEAEETMHKMSETFKETKRGVEEIYNKLAMNLISEVIIPLHKAQKDWALLIEELQINRPPRKLIKLDDGEIKVSIKGWKIRVDTKNAGITKKTSHGLLLLKAMLTLTDRAGYISYDDIENYFVSKGLKRITNERESRRRIWHAEEAMYRFLKIPKIHEEQKIIQKIRAKGLRLNNPTV